MKETLNWNYKMCPALLVLCEAWVCRSKSTWGIGALGTGGGGQRAQRRVVCQGVNVSDMAMWAHVWGVVRLGHVSGCVGVSGYGHVGTSGSECVVDTWGV